MTDKCFNLEIEGSRLHQTLLCMTVSHCFRSTFVAQLQYKLVGNCINSSDIRNVQIWRHKVWYAISEV